MKPAITESLGVLIKEEKLETVEHFVIENSLVLENIEPFPGYHGENLPLANKPDSLFLITDIEYPIETVFRTTQHLCCKLNMKIDACPVKITFPNLLLNGIRVRGLNNYSYTAEIQNCYQENGIKFLKKKFISDFGIIRLTKIFKFESLSFFVFKDLKAKDTYYLSIPYHLNWIQFADLTKKVKNNLENNNFDCALGFIFLPEMLEFVRIYVSNITINNLIQIREKYIDEITRMLEDSNKV